MQKAIAVIVMKITLLSCYFYHNFMAKSYKVLWWCVYRFYTFVVKRLQIYENIFVVRLILGQKKISIFAIDMRRKIIYVLWALLLLIILGVVGAFTAISKGWIGHLPKIEDLQNPVDKYATQIISSDGKLLGTWSYSKDNRIYAEYNSISPNLINALVATEDARFYEHSGIDVRALFRSLVKRGIFMQKSAGGGSTITQQLAKQLYTNVAKNSVQRALQKPIEWVIAVQLEKYYTKEEIITLYFNKFDFLNNAVGIKTASKTYFGKDPSQLTINEAATLVGMCKNPSLFNPVRHNERCRGRRNVVLGQMLKAGFITKAEYDTLKEEPLVLDFHRVDHKEGLATYFREYLRGVMMAKKPERDRYPEWNYQQYYQDSLSWEKDPLYGWCNKHKKKNGENYNIYEDGLRIYTTIDSRMQAYAEQAVIEHIAGKLQPAFDKEKRRKKTAPFSSMLSTADVEKIMKRSKMQSERYIMMKKAGCSDSEIDEAFNTKTEMSVAKYVVSRDEKGAVKNVDIIEVDTMLTPMDSIRYYKHFLRSGFMSMDAKTGAVKAYVGGLDYTHFQYDMVTLGRRQVGSTIKPFLYSLAMENGFTPCDEAPNVQETYNINGVDWTPRNGSRARYGEMVTLKWGLANSNNWISAWLMNQLDPVQLVDLMHQFGINNKKIDPVMSLCLGPCEISVSEMVSAYSAFANKGIRAQPMFVTRIEDSEGNIVAEFQPQVNEVISEMSSLKMVDMLRAVVDHGTAARIRWMFKIKADMGGKTGTTNRNSDGWFMGFTPELVSGCWVGGEDRDIHFDNMANGQGAEQALPIYGKYMKMVYADESLPYKESATFAFPENFSLCNEQSYGKEEVMEVGDAASSATGNTNKAPQQKQSGGIDEIFD